MIQFEAISSGSSGNSILVRDGESTLLVDAGISTKRITEELRIYGLEPKDLSGIFITHEHIDHVAALPLIAVKYQIPVYMSEGTFYRVEHSSRDPEGLLKPLFKPVRAGEYFTLGSFLVKPFQTFHDAQEPLAYRFESGGKAFAVFTDSGSYTEETVEMLSGLDGLLLESNHDIRMLEVGPYPYELKRRILSRFGHLSNDDAAELVGRIWSPRLKVLLLGHISENNNYPDIVRVTMENRLKEMGVLDRVLLSVAERGVKTPMFTL
ncbi:MAG: MBL fold metallo-hydrolase [Lachnospiraceae bacterium]|nr:MBL fold metallo-hydrolase [Lachnospiraceae bacterium]